MIICFSIDVFHSDSYNRDIAVSVSESVVITRDFMTNFLTEFYLQLTTISWLSVRTVQRSSKSPLSHSEDDRAGGSGSFLTIICSVFSSILETFSGSDAASLDSGWPVAEPEVVMVTRAEERVRSGTS